MNAISIRDAVKILHGPTRNWIGVREELPRLARDSTSRLSSIRDVVLYLLPDYLPDPRRRINIESDDVASQQFYKKYVSTGYADWAKMLRHFPGLPICRRTSYGPSHGVICQGGFITITGEAKSVTYRDGASVVQYGRIEHCGNNVFYDVDTSEFIVENVRYIYPCDPTNYFALPCGLVLHKARKGAVLINVATHEFRPVIIPLCNATYYDDYGRFYFGVASIWAETRIYYR